jgi:hypothetical protein
MYKFEKHKHSCFRSAVTWLLIVLLLCLSACKTNQGDTKDAGFSEMESGSGSAVSSDEKTSSNEETSLNDASSQNSESHISSNINSSNSASSLGNSSSNAGSTRTTTTKSDVSLVGSDSASAAFDGDENTIWQAAVNGETELSYTFPKQKNFNIIRFYESGTMVQSVKVEVEQDGSYLTVYQQDEMGTRTGVLDQTYAAQKVKVTVKANSAITIKDIVFEEKIAVSGKSPFRIVGYVTPDMTGATTNYDKLDTVTDLIMIGYGGWNVNGSFDYCYNSQSVMEANLQTIRNKIGSRDVKMWFSIGNFLTDTNRYELISTEDARLRLVNFCVNIVDQYSFAGIDVDYEYPVDQNAWDYYGLFLTKLSDALHAKGKLLSAAMAPWGVSLSSEAKNAVDYVNIMAYDINDSRKRHAGYKLARTSIQYFLDLGFHENQLVLGLAFYGVSTVDSSASDSGHPYSYYIQRYRTAIKTYTNEVNNIYFTGRDMNKDKTLLALEKGISGVFAWHFACDIPLSDSRSLFGGIQDVVNRFEK